ncbi:Hypothetical predicted protein [Mytilus galloprovincialis]|uniref:Uncharacterized protein n=1 Tax=Mytilus galloprovincialis TaxID=29158 RepID=A0A8B6ERR7_MYTGA|nr:Hypothetical predicted protein [Mytilus galloprovincialis]
MAVYVPGLVSVIVFYVIFLLLGLWAAWKSRKVTKNSEDVLLAGRSIGMLLGIFTMTATWVEGGFINGTAEGVYSGGLVGSQAPFAYSVCLAFSGFFFARRMRQNGYATIIDPFQQKYGRYDGVLAAKSAYIAELLSYLGVIGCFIVVIPSLLVGIIATQTDWSMTTYMSGNSSVLADEDIPLVLPLVMEHLCPKAVALFGLGAVAAAVMSSVDSAVLSSSGQFSRNVYKRIIRKTASEKEQIWVLRASTIVFGVIATSVSIYVRSIYALWVLCSDIIYVILFPQLTCAIYFSSANTYGSLVAFIVGLFFRVAGGEITLGLDPIIKYPWHKVDDDGTVVQLFPHKTLSMLLSLFSLLFVSWFTNWLFDNGILSPKFDILRKHSRTKYKNKYVISTSDASDVKELGNYKINAAFTTDSF